MSSDEDSGCGVCGDELCPGCEEFKPNKRILRGFSILVVFGSVWFAIGQFIQFSSSDSQNSQSGTEVSLPESQSTTNLSKTTDESSVVDTTPISSTTVSTPPATATTATTASELAAAFANRSNGEVLTNVAINGAAGTKVGSINGVAGNFKTGPVGVGTNPTLTFACALPGSQAALLPATGQAGVISLTVPTVGVDGGATAEQVAYAFSGIQAGASFANINQLKNLGSALGGEFTAGNLTGWSTNSSNNTATITFTSSIPNTGITPDLKGTIAGDFPGTPVITSKTDGVANVTQTSTAAFVALTPGQTLQLNGLTFTAGSAGTTPAQLAQAFANISAASSQCSNTPALWSEVNKVGKNFSATDL